MHCWSVVPADEHASCTSRLPVSFCSISGRACEGKDMHRPRTSHKAAAYCEWKRQLKLCVGLQQNIGAPHTVHAHHARTHARTHTHTHAHTITELTLPLSNGERPLHYGHNAMNVRPEQGMGALTVVNVTVTVKVSLHIQACGKGSGAVRGIPSCSCIRQQCGQTLHSVLFFQMCLVLNSQ